MNRPIKFRAWIPHDKTLRYNISVDRGKAIDVLNAFFRDTAKDGLVWMQFTGLLDKNGKEIYEGDIVVKDEYIWFDDGEPNYRGTVEWVYSQWQVVAHCVNQKKAGISDGINEGMNDDGIEDGERSDWIVIGNVFENPDLLPHE